MTEFRMPSLGADMEAGTLVEWLVKPGDHVKRGDVVAVVETQKGAIEIEIFQEGEIEQILVDLNATVPIGTPLALIRSGHDAEPTPLVTTPAQVVNPPAPPTPASPSIAPVVERLPARPATPPVAIPPRVAGRVRASPAARRLAMKNGVDLSVVAGSGPGGAIIYTDIAQGPGEFPVAGEKKAARGLNLEAMRIAIAAAMARSKREIPHYYLAHQLDVTACERWLTATNANRSPDGRLLFGALAIKSVAVAARRFPIFNGFYRNGTFERADAVHVGVAIAIRGGGLAAPALHDADHLTLDELMDRMRDLVRRTRIGRIRSSEISDPTITVSSLGERGVEALYGIIYPPQVAIVGFGKVVTRPWVVDGAIGPRSIVTVTLSADHRASDGHAGALFLAEIERTLQEPTKL